MKIILDNIGKKYNYHWIFRNLNQELTGPSHWGILGNNGSGKSTLLKLLTGFLSPSEGSIKWDEELTNTTIFRYIGIASPHLELIEEFSLIEILTFHNKFRSFIDGNTVQSLVGLSGLGKNADKPLRYYSSGMKQRVKLILAIMSNNPLIILDEPCSNLDEQSIAWYQKLVKDFTADRLLIIGSNDKNTECFSCQHFINLSVL